MKIFPLLFLSLIIATSSFSQTTKGQFLIGGSISFESEKSENSINPSNSLSNFSVSPAIGYFIVDGLAGGSRLDLSWYDSKSDDVETHFINTTISPFLRFYFLPAPKKVNAFIDVSYIHKRHNFSNLGYIEKARGYYLSAGPSIFLTDHIALEFTLGYKHTDSDDFGTTKTDTFNSGFGLQIHLGKFKKKSTAAGVRQQRPGMSQR